jgi:hypothetical protein
VEKKISSWVRIILFMTGAIALSVLGNNLPFWVWALVFVAIELVGKMLIRLIVWFLNRNKDKNDL